ncbi:hypothetical protein BC939DRAFT_526770 [Gamsiella multidivaricata]|uniref:uncharacterized protein n=1 Tax=Gamsiella multidivaricata TaxID=101098 RepID=UPI002220832A|nr:uncharacterized protein BC939DRAFT_526770 [Gamsiella multidivaricata]KAI7828128.1 hypothetical protein BC939DRAFT_526770 [Gamsiella multidivaricata]
MTIQGLHVTSLMPSSSEFTAYNGHFGGKLLKLYQITYQEFIPRNLASSDWRTGPYFHGTGHCGCLVKRVEEGDPITIKAQEWCGNPQCATQGILNHGHLLTWSRGEVPTATGYATNKSGNHFLLSYFVCKARNFGAGGYSSNPPRHRPEPTMTAYAPILAPSSAVIGRSVPATVAAWAQRCRQLFSTAQRIF